MSMPHRFFFSILLFSLFSSLALSGCKSETVIDQWINKGETQAVSRTEVSGAPEQASRVYMDEITGLMSGFDGSHLTLRSDEDWYVFDVSEAAIECAQGLLGGDDLSVIYEGKADGSETASVKALKVTDALHQEDPMEDHIISGILQSIGSYHLTLLDESGQALDFPIIGRPLAFHKGLQIGSGITLHVRGEVLEGSPESGPDASHVRVLSVSDEDPFSSLEAPEVPNEITDVYSQAQVMRVTVNSLADQVLKVVPRGKEGVELTLDLLQVPCSFPEGSAPGTTLNLYYYGNFNDKDLTGIQLICLIGSDPSAKRSSQELPSVSGTIVGATANTLTLETADRTRMTCYTSNVSKPAGLVLAIGTRIRVEFRPNPEETSSIYHISAITQET